METYLCMSPHRLVHFRVRCLYTQAYNVAYYAHNFIEFYGGGGGGADIASRKVFASANIRLRVTRSD